MSKNWYVVQTKPNAEMRACENLERQGYEIYFPRILKQRRHARRTTMVKRPLFPRYFFVHLDTLKERWYPILSTFGVSTLIRHGADPAAVPEGIVEELQRREAEGTLGAAPGVENLPPGTPIEVREGPFADLCGEFIRLSEKDRVLVLLDLLGRKVKATVAVDSVVPAK
jgi:transcriptional antiterminator RfaH